LEEALKFKLNEKTLFGILHHLSPKDHIVKILVMVVGGPQTRVGSHRLYVQLARKLVHEDMAVFRFDYEGIGDSEGEFVGYKSAGPSIEAAVNFLYAQCPSLKKIVIWSLCDGSSICMKMGYEIENMIEGMILCNPYLHEETGKAKTIIKFYYIKRLMEKNFWEKIFKMKFSPMESAKSMKELFKNAWFRQEENNEEDFQMDIHPLEIVDGLVKFNKPIFFLLSNDDLTAKHFYDFYKDNKKYFKVLNQKDFQFQFIDSADHTFTNSSSKEKLSKILPPILDVLFNLNDN